MSAIVVLIMLIQLPLLPSTYRGALLLRDALWLAKTIEDHGPSLRIEWVDECTSGADQDSGDSGTD